ncbi:hypothetical protein HYV86_01210 [Candidatus Woesearchaeota archaeon]|nr:hypothetical protein [Candidatus Woesearchaeota archaeon]
MNNKYKLIVGVCEGEGAFQQREMFEPLYFDTLEQVRKEYAKILRDVKSSNKKIWFAKVWEFGKEDYKDMGDDVLEE